jgi:hypothetical protein
MYGLEGLKSQVIDALHESDMQLGRPVSLILVGAQLISSGYTLDETFNAIRSLIDDRTIVTASGDRCCQPLLPN